MDLLDDDPAFTTPPRKKTCTEAAGHALEAVTARSCDVPMARRVRFRGKAAAPADLVTPSPLDAIVAKIGLAPTDRTSPLPKGGWRRRAHPQCLQASSTLFALTGRKDGVPHVFDLGLRVCQTCRRKPVSLAAAKPGTSSEEVAVVKKELDSPVPELLSDLSKWDEDTPEVLLQEYVHTAGNALRHDLDRWHCALRIVRLVERGDFSSFREAERGLEALKINRKELALAQTMWQDVDDKLALANAMPGGFGRGDARAVA